MEFCQRVLRDEETVIYQIIAKFEKGIFFTGQDPLVILLNFLKEGECLKFIPHCEELPLLEAMEPEQVYVWVELYLCGKKGGRQNLERNVEFLDQERNLVIIKEISKENVVLLNSYDLEEERPKLLPDTIADLTQEIFLLMREIGERLERVDGSGWEEIGIKLGKLTVQLADRVSMNCSVVNGSGIEEGWLKRTIFSLSAFSQKLMRVGNNFISSQELKGDAELIVKTLDALLNNSSAVEQVIKADVDENLVKLILDQQREYIRLNKDKDPLLYIPSLVNVVSSLLLLVGERERAERFCLEAQTWDDSEKALNYVEEKLRKEIRKEKTGESSNSHPL
ncbi:MAG: hypothetical protein ACPLGZ_03290, partial [Candidatus Pelagibacter ubique]